MIPIYPKSDLKSWGINGLINKTVPRLASYSYTQVFVFYLINTLCSVESDELEHNS
jgi:hypothetical protein